MPELPDVRVRPPEQGSLSPWRTPGWRPKLSEVSRRAWMGVIAAVAALAGVMVLYDVLVVTDEERLEGFVEDVTGPLDPSRIDGARARWVDLSRQPFEVSAMGRSLLYREGEEDALTERSQRALSPLYGAELRVLTSGIAVEGDGATVTLRLISRRRGMGRVEWRLRKHGDDWLVERLAVRR